MGKLEAESRSRSKRNELRKIILGTVKAAGTISVFVLAPNAVGAMVKLGLLPSPRQNDVITRASDRLVRSGLVVWEDGKLRLTTKGERELLQLSMRDRAQAQPKRWDKKWRVLTFDIPEKRKGLRQKLRHLLMDIGFTRLQDSVWVYPYDCEDLITLLKGELRVGNAILYMIVDFIEGDATLRKHFKLH